MGLRPAHRDENRVPKAVLIPNGLPATFDGVQWGFNVNDSHFLIPVGFVLASVAPRKGESMSGPQRLVSFMLVCASSVIVAGAQSQTTSGPEVRKLAVMVGSFTVEDEVKAGAMGPNSPAMKFSGTEDCRWTAGGFAVICEAVLYRPGRKYSDASFVYYDPTSKTYRYHAVDSSGGTEDKIGTVNGDVWTWLGESVFAGKPYHTRYIMKFVSADSFEYTDESGESESSMKVFVSGKETRVAATKPAKSQSTQ